MLRAVPIALLLALAAAAPAAAQDPVPTPTPTPTPEPEPRIAQGVSAAGVDLSNLTISEATVRLNDTLDAPLSAPLVVAVAGHRYVLRVSRTKFAFDANRTARRAYQAGQNSAGTAPEGGGAAAGVDVALAVKFRGTVVRKFSWSIARKVRIAPRNARLRITLRRMVRYKAHTGRRLDARALRKQLQAALADPRIARLFKPGREHIKPKVTRHDLRRLYPTVVTVDRSHFRLRLFKRLRLSKTYGVAVGMPAYPTPTGLFHIQSRQVNPTWSVPNSPWAGELAGQSVSGSDPSNPLKARWLGVSGSVGIHGTGQEYSIGSRASHGCIRMRVADVIDLYPRVPMGAPVLIR
jgi:lipoprotein-anchoring transpeptidase ErfK/SrfK